MIDVVWTGRIEDEEKPFALRHTTMMGEWADCSSNAESVASDIAVDFFDNGGQYGDFFGDSDGAAIVLEIHSPASVSGKYSVYIVKSISARATKVRA